MWHFAHPLLTEFSIVWSFLYDSCPAFQQINSMLQLQKKLHFSFFPTSWRRMARWKISHRMHHSTALLKQEADAVYTSSFAIYSGFGGYRCNNTPHSPTNWIFMKTNVSDAVRAMLRLTTCTRGQDFDFAPLPRQKCGRRSHGIGWQAMSIGELIRCNLKWNVLGRWLVIIILSNSQWIVWKLSI